MDEAPQPNSVLPVGPALDDPPAAPPLPRGPGPSWGQGRSFVHLADRGPSADILHPPISGPVSSGTTLRRGFNAWRGTVCSLQSSSASVSPSVRFPATGVEWRRECAKPVAGGDRRGPRGGPGGGGVAPRELPALGICPLHGALGRGSAQEPGKWHTDPLLSPQCFLLLI